MSIRESEQKPASSAPRPQVQASGDASDVRPRGFLGRLQALLLDVRSEIRKVTWPTPLEARNLTIVVIGISVFVGGLLGIVDLLLVGGIRLLTSLAGQ